MLKYILIITSLLCTFDIQSQSIVSFHWIERIKVENIPSLTDPKLKNYAIIKVLNSPTEIDFDFGLVGKAIAKVERKGELWLWVPKDAKSVTIFNNSLKELCYYPFDKELEDGEVYEMRIISGQNHTSVNNKNATKWLTIDSYPDGATIFIDNVNIGLTPYYGSLRIGKHKVRMEVDGVKKEETIKVSRRTKYSIVMDLTRPEINEDTTEAREVFYVEPNPEYPGGYEQMPKFLQDNLKYADFDSVNFIKKTAFLQFIVSETGKVTNVKVLRGIGRKYDKEAVRVVKMMPKWIPGRQNNRAVPVMYQIPVKFQIHKKTYPTKTVE